MIPQGTLSDFEMSIKSNICNSPIKAIIDIFDK
jgi:hypothetical protein